MRREQKLIWFRLIILVGFVSAVFYHYVLSAYFRLGVPYDTFLPSPKVGFSDFISVLQHDTSLSDYFPFTQLIIIFFGYIQPPMLSLIVFWSIFLIFLIYYLWINVKTSDKLDSMLNVLIFSLFTFPVIYSLTSANFETFNFISLSLFIYFYQKQKTKLAIVFLSLAIALKGFPVLFIIILMSDKKYKEIVYTVIGVFLLTIIPMLLIGTGFLDNFYLTVSNLKLFVFNSPEQLSFNHSFLGLIFAIVDINEMNLNLGSMVLIYSIVMLAFCMAISYYVAKGSYYFWEKVSILVCMICLFPPVSFDDTLIYLFIPILLFINWDIKNNRVLSDKDEMLTKGRAIIDYVLIISFALLLIPKNYRLFINYYDGSVINPLLLLFILFILLGKINHKKYFLATI